MVVFLNTSNSPVNIEYTSGLKAFRKQVAPGFITAFRGLQTADQIKNIGTLRAHNVAMYNYEAGIFINGSIQTAFNGTTTATGVTFSFNSNPSTGHTFVTSANTIMANKTMSAATIGGVLYVSFSGDIFTTTSWVLTANTTSFSAFGVTVQGAGSTLLATGGTNTVSVSASTVVAAHAGAFLFVDSSANNNQIFGSSSLAAGYAALKAKI